MASTKPNIDGVPEEEVQSSDGSSDESQRGDDNGSDIESHVDESELSQSLSPTSKLSVHSLCSPSWLPKFESRSGRRHAMLPETSIFGFMIAKTSTTLVKTSMATHIASP